MLIGMAGLTACTTDNSNPPDATVQDSPEKYMRTLLLKILNKLI